HRTVLGQRRDPPAVGPLDDRDVVTAPGSAHPDHAAAQHGRAAGACGQPRRRGRTSTRQSVASAATGDGRTAERAGSTDATSPAASAMTTTAASCGHGTPRLSDPSPPSTTAAPAQPYSSPATPPTR